MASPDVLDFERLLAPIAGDNPAGPDLRADDALGPTYYAIKDARSAARAAERQLLAGDDGAASPPDWRPVIQNGTKALADKTKDLEIVAYLIEALVRQHGFAGLRDGFRLARELVERFWDGLYPLPDEEGLETRVAPLTGLNGDDGEGTLISPIARVSLTEGNSAGPFSWYHYQQACAVQQIADEDTRAKRLKQGAVSMETVEKAVGETPTPFFVNLVEDLGQCQDEFARLSTALEERCGDRAPPSSQIRAALDGCLTAVRSIARHKLPMEVPQEPAAAEEEAQPEGAAEQANGAATPVGALRTREDALRTLLQVADFFRRNEPHTPVSYALEQAVRWGRMSLPELLTELIPDDAARGQFFKQVGIRPGEGPPP
jgi:type VI secretion system protein ImpA